MKFKQVYKPNEPRFKPHQDVLKTYKDKIPVHLKSLWLIDGFGKYNNGLIELINPDRYNPYLKSWLKESNLECIPFAINGFGEIFYYRKHEKDYEDICILDLHHNGESAFIESSLEQFFEEFLTNDTYRASWLKEELFEHSIKKHHKLLNDEIFVCNNRLNPIECSNHSTFKTDVFAYYDILLEDQNHGAI